MFYLSPYRVSAPAQSPRTTSCLLSSRHIHTALTLWRRRPRIIDPQTPTLLLAWRGARSVLQLICLGPFSCRRTQSSHTLCLGHRCHLRLCCLGCQQTRRSKNRKGSLGLFRNLWASCMRAYFLSFSLSVQVSSIFLTLCICLVRKANTLEHFFITGTDALAPRIGLPNP